MLGRYPLSTIDLCTLNASSCLGDHRGKGLWIRCWGIRRYLWIMVVFPKLQWEQLGWNPKLIPLEFNIGDTSKSMEHQRSNVAVKIVHNMLRHSHSCCIYASTGKSCNVWCYYHCVVHWVGWTHCLFVTQFRGYLRIWILYHLLSPWNKTGDRASQIFPLLSLWFLWLAHEFISEPKVQMKIHSNSHQSLIGSGMVEIVDQQYQPWEQQIPSPLASMV